MEPAADVEPLSSQWVEDAKDQLDNLALWAVDRDEAASEGSSVDDWPAERRALIEQTIDNVLDVASCIPEGTSDPGLVPVFLRATALRRAAENDTEGTDPGWKVHEAALELRDSLHLMIRRLERLTLDDPTHAAEYVIQALEPLGTEELAKLLGVSGKTVSQWRNGHVSSIRKEPERVVDVAQTVMYLRSSWSPHGVLAWFNEPREQFEGKSALELIGTQGREGAAKVRGLARGSRTQLGG